MNDLLLYIRKEQLKTRDENEWRMLSVMIEEIKDCEQFSAMGFYTIDRSTLTATLGTVITYLIILIQTVTCSK